MNGAKVLKAVDEPAPATEPHDPEQAGLTVGQLYNRMVGALTHALIAERTGQRAEAKRHLNEANGYMRTWRARKDTV